MAAFGANLLLYHCSTEAFSRLHKNALDQFVCLQYTQEQAFTVYFQISASTSITKYSTIKNRFRSCSRVKQCAISKSGFSRSHQLRIFSAESLPPIPLVSAPDVDPAFCSNDEILALGYLPDAIPSDTQERNFFRLR